MNTPRRDLLLSALLAPAAAWFSGPAAAQLRDGSNPDASANWQKVRASLFGTRAIDSRATDVIALDVPARAEDAAIVPVAIRAQFAQSPQRFIKRVWLIIDNNPSPVAAIFSYSQDSGRADIETRVRVDEYTHVRAIAETGDDQLVMATRWVKASGGCSAPPGKDPQAALATLGQMRLRADTAAPARQPLLAQLMISHPNHSGLAMDQSTRQYTPAHFVRQINVTYAGRQVLSADVDFSISENPNLRFYFVPAPGSEASGELRAQVVDSHDLKFEIGTKVNLGA